METTERSKMNGKPVYFTDNRILNLDSGFAPKLLCDGPTFTAGTACVYDCSFCYVPAVMMKTVKGKFGDVKHEDIVIRRNNAVSVLRGQLTTAKGTPKFLNPDDRRVIYASPLVDVAGNMELVKETVELCKVILELTNWDIRLLSKSNLLPKIAQSLAEGSLIYKNYAKLARDRVIYGVSTGTLDNKLAAAFEQGTPLVSKRIESLHWLQDNGFRTFGMICPSLPTWTPGDDPIDAYAEFSRKMTEAIRVDRCEHVWAEVINTRGVSFVRTEKALRDAGYGAIADELAKVSHDKDEWEAYARLTFEGHKRYIPGNKLRFLQYVNDKNRGYWGKEVVNGAVLL